MIYKLFLSAMPSREMLVVIAIMGLCAVKPGSVASVTSQEVSPKLCIITDLEVSSKFDF